MTSQEKIAFLLKEKNCTVYALSKELDIAISTLDALYKGYNKSIRSRKNREIIDKAIRRIEREK